MLLSRDAGEKESLLLCLDKYLDPYFGCELPWKDEVYHLLQQMILAENTTSVKEGALS